MLNPMRSAHHGYREVNQFVAEEEEEGRNVVTEDVDLEAGPSSFREVTRLSSKVEGKRRVAWDAGASEMTILHPNIHKEDKIHEEDSSDNEVPQSFKVEATPHAGLAAVEGPSQLARGQALYSTSGRKLPPALPTVIDNSPSPVPRSSKVLEEDYAISPATRSRQPKTLMRGLDDHEKALWNWVNVYNLDAFLQEVYYYYEGNGVYSIALARGLNLL
jgi:autophagy-related protein 9